MLKFIAALIKHCTIPAVVECHHVVMCTWWCITNTPPPPLRWAAVHLSAGARMAAAADCMAVGLSMCALHRLSSS